MTVIYLSHSPEETQKIAGDQALTLIHECEGKPLVIALEGELGAGKTTFIQAFAEALGVHEKVKSPTFVLMKTYNLQLTTYNKKFKTLYHLDCYRLKDYKDLEVLGIQDILNNPENIVLIEWAERVAEILPKQHWVVHIDHPPVGRAGVSEQERNIKITRY